MRNFKWPSTKMTFLIHNSTIETFSGFLCESGIVICSWRVTLSYAYSPFNQQIFPKNNSIVPSYFYSLEIDLVVRKKENTHK